MGGQTLGDCQQQCQRVFGGGHARRVRGVAHRHSGGVGRGNIDVVVADSGTRDHPNPRRQGERVGVPRAGGPGDNALRAGEIGVIGADHDRLSGHKVVILGRKGPVEKEARKVSGRHPADPSLVGAMPTTEHGATRLSG